ncbi:MAG: hypothetical protein RL693_214 [Verrucomicrobiota bacterium]|jgi:hypothetical protein
MYNKAPGPLNKVTAVESSFFQPFSMFESFGFCELTDILTYVEECLVSGIVHPGFGGNGLTTKQSAPEGEPDGVLIAYPPQMRSGVLSRLLIQGERKILVGATVYFSEGTINRFELDSISLSDDRSDAVLHGTLAGEIQISLYEPSFLGDRIWHGAGADHDIALYAIAYHYKTGVPPPIDMQDPFKRDGSKTKLRFDEAAFIVPIKDAPPSYYAVVGPVKKVSSYGLTVCNQEIIVIRVAMARIDSEDDESEALKDIDVDVYVSQYLFDKCGIPNVGDIFQVNVRMCSRLWMANPYR